MNTTFQGEQPTLCATALLYISATQASGAPTSTPAPRRGGDQEQLEHAPSVVFVFQRHEWMGGLVLAGVTKEERMGDFNLKLESAS